MQNEAADGLRVAHGRLYEHILQECLTQPRSLEEMLPVFAAVKHGCRANRHQAVFEDIVVPRLMRGLEYYAIRQLGAWGAMLSSLEGFFSSPWRILVDGLSAEVSARVSGWAGWLLQALGRSREAVKPLSMSESIYVSEELSDSDDRWWWAGLCAVVLREVHMNLGNLARAQDTGERALAYAVRSGQKPLENLCRWGLGDVLFPDGRARGRGDGVRGSGARRGR